MNTYLVRRFTDLERRFTDLFYEKENRLSVLESFVDYYCDTFYISQTNGRNYGAIVIEFDEKYINLLYRIHSKSSNVDPLITVFSVTEGEHE